MPSTVLVNYEKDLLGTNPNNLITNEPHTVSPVARAFALDYGPFFETGLVVKNGTNGDILTPEVDYSVAVLYLKASEDSGKAVRCFIVINNLALTNVLVTYRTIGGEYTRYTTVLQELISNVSLDERPVEWGSLLGLPEGFTPEPHMHTLEEIYNYGSLYSKLEDIRQAILTGNQASIDELRAWVLVQTGSSTNTIATTQEAIEANDQNKRITPYTLGYVLDSRIGELDIPSFE